MPRSVSGSTWLAATADMPWSASGSLGLAASMDIWAWSVGWVGLKSRLGGAWEDGPILGMGTQGFQIRVLRVLPPVSSLEGPAEGWYSSADSQTPGQASVRSTMSWLAGQPSEGALASICV